MAQSVTKLPVKIEEKKSEGKGSLLQSWGHPFESLHHEVNKLFEDFERGMWRPFSRSSLFDFEPFWKREMGATAPAVDVIEKEDTYEVTAELPGMDEKNIEVKLEDGGLRIKGEKQEQKEEKKKGYYLHERQFGTFERYFSIPESVDIDKIEASFKKGVLTVTLPKRPEAQKPSKKIDVKAA